MTTPIAALRLAPVIMVAGILVGCASSASSEQSTPPPSLAPSAEPSTSAMPSASAEPSVSAKPTGPGAFHVALAHATRHVVTVDVIDASGGVLEASTGAPGDGASVEPLKLFVANDDPTTLRLTWVGGPCDSANTLVIDGAARQFVLVQPECTGDAIGFDRILLLRFAEPIPAGDVEAILQAGADTPG